MHTHQRRVWRWEGIPPKTPQPRLLALSGLDGKLTWGFCHSDNTIFGRGTKFKIYRIEKHWILDEITKFNAHQIFLLYCNRNMTECFILYICVGGSKQQHMTVKIWQFSGTEWKNVIPNASTMWNTDEDMVEILIKQKVKHVLRYISTLCPHAVVHSYTHCSTLTSIYRGGQVTVYVYICAVSQTLVWDMLVSYKEIFSPHPPTVLWKWWQLYLSQTAHEWLISSLEVGYLIWQSMTILVKLRDMLKQLRLNEGAICHNTKPYTASTCFLQMALLTCVVHLWQYIL